MRTTQAARYARWSGTIAVLLAMAVSGVYARRAWQAHLAHLGMRPSVPSAVQQQTAGFAISKVTGDRTEYTVRASHATEFTQGGRSVLQDVWVTAYGQDGQRFDNLRTRTCDYLEPAGDIVCGGDVHMDLQSAEDARLHPNTASGEDPSAQILHVDTRGVSFNRGSGLATTDHPVTIHFPRGEGRAVGFRWDAGKGELNLVSSVTMTLRGAAMPGDPAPDVPLSVSSNSLTYDRDRRVIHFAGAVEAHRGVPELTAGKMDLQLDERMQVQRIVASERPLLRDTAHGGPVLVSADEFSAEVLPSGAIGTVYATGHVHTDAHMAEGEDQMQSERAVIEMEGNSDQPRKLTASGGVTAVAARSGGLSETLTSTTLEVNFAAGDKPGEVRVASATTPAGTIDWEEPARSGGRSATQRVHMTSQHWAATFGNENELEQLEGSGGTQVERRIGEEPATTGSSDNLMARFASTGEWSTIDQTGNFTLRQPDRTARANSAHYDRLADTLALSGAVQLSDADSITNAQSATLHQASSEMHAEGRVSSIQIAAGAGGADFASGPARVSSDRLDANSATGTATYSGKARLWQGDSVVEAEAIQLDRASRVMTAAGRVRAVFPQMPPAAGGSSAKAAATKPTLWHAEAARMTYASDEGRGHLETDVHAHSDQGSIRSDSMDLFFAPTEPSGAGVARPGAEGKSSAVLPTPGGAGRQLSRAAGYGNVEVTEQDRRGNSSRADYTAADGKFVLSGGSPVVHDSSGNSVAGRQLTLVYADDTIVVDSAEGLRTLTLHSVGK